MKRQSWDDKQLDRLKAELRKKDNTKEAWMEICDLHDLPAMQAKELAFQVVPPITVIDMDTPDFRFYPAGPRIIVDADVLPKLREAWARERAAPPVRVLSARKFTPLKKNA